MVLGMLQSEWEAEGSVATIYWPQRLSVEMERMSRRVVGKL